MEWRREEQIEKRKEIQKKKEKLTASVWIGWRVKSSDVSNDVNEEEEPRTRNSFVNLYDRKNSVRKNERKREERRKREKRRRRRRRGSNFYDSKFTCIKIKITIKKKDNDLKEGKKTVFFGRERNRCREKESEKERQVNDRNWIRQL